MLQQSHENGKVFTAGLRQSKPGFRARGAELHHQFVTPGLSTRLARMPRSEGAARSRGRTSWVLVGTSGGEDAFRAKKGALQCLTSLG